MPLKLVPVADVAMYMAMQVGCFYLQTRREREYGLRGRLVPIGDVSAIIASSDLVTIIVGDNLFSHRTHGPNFISCLADYGFEFRPISDLVFHPA